MNNYKMLISYDGSRYYGWEHQPGIELTIQGKLENVLERLCGVKTDVIGAGRTDAGVHAKGMVCNAFFDTDLSEKEIRDYFNRYLPDDICVKDVKLASERFHSRYKAVGKTYRYTCYVGDTKPVFDRKYVYCLDYVPDIDRMQEAADILMGEHDFAAFCSNPRMKKSTVRIVDNINIVRNGSYMYFTYHGTGFLQHMVRILTGTLLEIGNGKRDVSSINELFVCKDRKMAGFTAPAEGLCLIEVDYN